MSSANPVQETANLTRIRDNQRRSRARRKEYLQSLEARWRACELQGVEASAEIQAAARKVIEENRRLRGLLRAKGMIEGDIDSFLRNEGEVEVGIGVLEGMLGARKPCGEGGRGCGERCKEATVWVGGSSNSNEQQQPTPPSTSSPIYPQLSEFDTDIPPFLFPSTDTDPTPNLASVIQTNNTTSCLFGASLLTDIGAKASQEEVTAAMGCPPGGVGDCEVDNTMLLGVMDRFTGGV